MHRNFKCRSYGGPGGRATRRCLCDDDDATIDDGDASDDANTHTARGTGQYRRTGSNCENLIIANWEFFSSSQTFDSQTYFINPLPTVTHDCNVT